MQPDGTVSVSYTHLDVYKRQSADIQVTAREIDFVTRFERNWQHLRDILGIMRPIKKTPGAVLKSKYAEGTLPVSYTHLLEAQEP